MTTPPPDGFFEPVRRSLTQPILMGGAPRAFAIANGTLAAAIGIGLQLWMLGLGMFIVGQAVGAWIGRRDPHFVEVIRRHARYPTRFRV